MNRLTLRLATALASAVIPIAALAQEPTPPPVQEEQRTQNTFLRHRMFIHETVDRMNDHRHYRQLRPIRWSSAFRLPTRMHYQELEIETACEWRTDDPDVGLWLPPFGTPSTLPTGPGTTPIVPGTTPTIPQQPTIPSLTTTLTTVTPVSPFTVIPIATPFDPFPKPIDPRPKPQDPNPQPQREDLNPLPKLVNADPRPSPFDPNPRPVEPNPKPKPGDPDPKPKPEDLNPLPKLVNADPRPSPFDPNPKPVEPNPKPKPPAADPKPKPRNPRPAQDPFETERVPLDPRLVDRSAKKEQISISLGYGHRLGSFVVNDNSSATTQFIDTLVGISLNRIGTATKPTPSKSGALSGSFTDSDSLDDGVPLTGPSLSLPLKSDVTEWDFLSWLAEDTRMELYGHAYFGQAEMLSVEFDMAIYGLGVRTILPLVGTPSTTFQLGGTVAMGIGYMDTDVGSLVGFEPALGLQATIHLYGNVALNLNTDYYFFLTDGAVYEGPAVTGGLTIGF